VVFQTRRQAFGRRNSNISRSGPEYQHHHVHLWSQIRSRHPFLHCPVELSQTSKHNVLVSGCSEGEKPPLRNKLSGPGLTTVNTSRSVRPPTNTHASWYNSTTSHQRDCTTRCYLGPSVQTYKTSSSHSFSWACFHDLRSSMLHLP
jgi:hypothetical protein